jgi:hypothetical protein
MSIGRPFLALKINVKNLHIFVFNALPTFTREIETMLCLNFIKSNRQRNVSELFEKFPFNLLLEDSFF